jgi:hypothetical protein
MTAIQELLEDLGELFSRVKNVKFLVFRCGSNNFTCNDGSCTSLLHLCDKIRHCFDGSDEDPAYCRGLAFCSSEQFECGVYGSCIPKEMECNGQLECEFGEDEENCDENKSYVCK